jgi:cation diffusion facilitator family transporter
VSIEFDQAIAVALAGLAVNLVSAWLLRGDDRHGDGHAAHRSHPHVGEPGHPHHHHDHNLRAAFLHVLADALTSVLVIAALLAGRIYAWVRMDALVGLVGALIIAHWSIGLLRSSAAVLLDTVPDRRLAAQMKRCLEQGADRVADLHLWRLGPVHLGVLVAIVTDNPQAPEAYKARLTAFAGLSHVTVEVHACPHATLAEAVA